ncbi:contactin-3 isoform X2 [Venturia canescens]|uniref:contactin-3 isoform X2 n=1 Tax=Venturia canescens TaxID=32260 RepID=UPI001C9D60D7|nr:contactin-3 isoform X2 [Venturia canescens]
MVGQNGAVLLLLLAGWWKALALVPPIHTVEVDIGQNVTVACADEDSVDDDNVSNVMWKRDGQLNAKRSNVFSNRALELVNVSLDDAGNYSCIVDDDADTIKTRINIEVKSPPPALHNVWVKPSTILANILWQVNGTGGYPIIDFTAEYRLKPAVGQEPEEWKPIIPMHIPPNSRQIDVYHLEPNTTYEFRVWATNRLGRGEIVEVEGRTHYTIEELELAKHLLAGFENFDRRIWVAAVGIVMGTLMVLGLGTCYLLYRECKAPSGGAGSD